MLRYKLILSVFIIINVFIFFWRYVEKQKNQKVERIENIQIIQLELEQNADNRYVDGIYFWTKDSLEKIEIFPEFTLVFFFSTYACQPCLENICNELRTFFPSYDTRLDVLFVCNDIENRLRNNFLGKRIAIMPEENNDILFKKYHVPLLKSDNHE